jgi:hypothetical protein
MSSTEIRQALDDATIRGLQILQLALPLGVVLFAGVVWFRASFQAHPAAADGPIPEPLTVKLAIGALVAFLLMERIGNTLLRRRINGARDLDVAARLEAFRAAFIVRLALLEAPALCGVALCFLATQGGPPADPMVWLGLLPAALFVLLSAMSFPNRERVTALLTE